MSAIPAFEIGVWNAWIFMLIYFLPTPILTRVHKGVLEESLKSYGGAQKKANNIMWVLWALASIYSIFLPMRLGTTWFYIGLPIALVGVVFFLIAVVSFFTTPLDREPMTTGLYRYSRHPAYITQLIMFIGVGIASVSWLFLLLTIAYTAIQLITAGTEEQMCLDKYGDTYREYMNKTPRWIGMPKSGEK